jgi:hypothetical protein
MFKTCGVTLYIWLKLDTTTGAHPPLPTDDTTVTDLTVATTSPTPTGWGLSRSEGEGGLPLSTLAACDRGREEGTPMTAHSHTLVSLSL